MKNKFKHGIAFLVIVSIWLHFSTVYADSIDTLTTYKTSHFNEETIELQVGKGLQINKLPSDKDYNYILIHIIDQEGVEHLNKTYSREVLLNGTPVYSFAYLKEGTYYVKLYKSEIQYSTYSGIIYGKALTVRVQGGEGFLLESKVYDLNRATYESNRTDTVALSYYKKASVDIQSDHPEIIKLANQITEGKTDDYTKAQAIHDWVCANIWYDWDAYLSNGPYGDTSALGTLQSKKSVCQGYASITAALLRAANIPAKLVSGYALGAGTGGSWNDELAISSDTNHAWNEAYINGRWIIIDTTWDSDNMFEAGKFSEFNGLYSYKYFDSTLESFSTDHKVIHNEDEIPNWWYEGAKTYYVNDKGIITKGWKTIEGERYFFGDDGVMKIGLQTIQGKRYYFDKSGMMLKNTSIIVSGKKYLIDANGVLKSK